MATVMLLFYLLPHQRPIQPLPVHDEADTDFDLRHVGEFLLAITFSTLGALIQARGNSGTNSHLLLLLDISLLAILLSLAASALHLVLHRQLRLPLASLFLHLAAFFTTAAVVLLITSSISPSLQWAPFAVFFSTLLFLVCLKRFPATSLHYVAALRRCRFVVFLIGPDADSDVQSPNNQLSPTSLMDEQQGHDLHRENETPAPSELQLRIPE